MSYIGQRKGGNALVLAGESMLRSERRCGLHEERRPFVSFVAGTFLNRLANRPETFGDPFHSDHSASMRAGRRSIRTLISTLAGLLAQALGLIAALGILSAHAADPVFPDIKKIKDRGKIIVAQCSVVQPGFYWFDDEGKHPNEPVYLYNGRRLIGFDISLAMKIAKELGVALEFDRSCCDFNTACLQVARGSADIAISKLSITPRRAQSVRFTKPYTVLGLGVLVNRVLEARAGSKMGLWELCNRLGTRIGVWKGTSAETYARELFPQADIRLYDTLEGLIQAVVDKELFAAVDEDFELRLKLHEEPRLALWLRFVPVPGKRDPIGIAVAPNSPNLVAFLNVLLEYEIEKINLEELLHKASRTKWKKQDLCGQAPGKGASIPLH